MVDGPQGFKSSIPPVVATTSPDLAVVRFHGRRTATWEAMGGLPTVERFRYLYDRDELREWVPRIDRGGRAGPRDTHVLMNNCYANYGSTNARELAAMLADELANAAGLTAAEPGVRYGRWSPRSSPGSSRASTGSGSRTRSRRGRPCASGRSTPRFLGFGDAVRGPVRRAWR